MALRKGDQALGISLAEGDGRGCFPEELGACLQAGEVQPFLPSGSGPLPKGSVCDVFWGTALPFNQ